MSRRQRTSPPSKTIAQWRRKEPGRIWLDGEGREYGKRVDPSFGRHAEEPSEEAWWVHLPRRALDPDQEDQNHLPVDEVLDMPFADDELILTNSKDPDQKIRVVVLQFPEYMPRGVRTTAINFNIEHRNDPAAAAEQSSESKDEA